MSTVAAAPLRLDVGCGAKLREGHVGVDVRALPNVGIVCNAWELDRHVAAGSVESIYSRHFFEHLTYAQGRNALRVFLRLLRPGGELHLIVPDIRYHAAQLLRSGPRSAANAKWTERQHALGSLWGWQRDGETEVWDVHKAGYDEDGLAQAMREAGFQRLKRLPDKSWHLSVRGYRSTEGQAQHNPNQLRQSR